MYATIIVSSGHQYQSMGNALDLVDEANNISKTTTAPTVRIVFGGKTLYEINGRTEKGTFFDATFEAEYTERLNSLLNRAN